MKIRDIDSQALVESGCCFLLSGAIFYLIISRAYLFYVTPKMLPYLCFSVVVFIVWGASNLLKDIKGRFKKKYMHCFILIIPVLMISLAQSASLQETDLGGYSSGLLTSEKSDGSKEKNNITSLDEEELEPIDNAAGDASMNEGSMLQGLDLENKTITISDNEVYGWLVEIFENSDKYIGFTLIQKGSVYRDETFSKNQFSLVRPLMTCCVADVAYIGFICNYESASQLAEDDWIQIEGKIAVHDSVVQIDISSTVPTEPASEYYVYPF